MSGNSSVDPSAATSHLRQRSTAQPSEQQTDSKDTASMLGPRSRAAAAKANGKEHKDELLSVQMEMGDAKERSELDGESRGDLNAEDTKGIILLVILYMLQGVPIGLAFGTMPFLLKSHASYSDIATFALSTYPYSLKLLWSPIVDSCFVNKLRLPFGTLSLGRRKSWIVPIQLCLGLMFWELSRHIDGWLSADHPDVNFITLIFFILIFFAATQDIAVDGWALTLLSQENVGYASTAQTIGINTGYFMSFTVFLAFNSADFANKYVRSVPLEVPMLSLGAYVHFWAYGFLAVTLWLLFVKKEDEEDPNQPDMDITSVYKSIWQICKLKNVKTFIVIHLIAKIGFQANDAVTGLKLVEKGLGREDLALAVLIDFPFQLVLGYYAAKWSRGSNALQPWVIAFVARLGFAVLSMGLVAGMPSAPVGVAYFILILVSTVTGSFASTVQFVGISAFHTQIADPLIGGTYMTLLNTVSNLGGTWPRYFVLKAVDAWTVSKCMPSTASHLGSASAELLAKAKEVVDQLPGAGECTSDSGRTACAAIGGSCVVERDGYYATSAACVLVGALTLAFYIWPACRKLQRLPLSAWRVSTPGATTAGRMD